MTEEIPEVKIKEDLDARVADLRGFMKEKLSSLPFEIVKKKKKVVKVEKEKIIE